MMIVGLREDYITNSVEWSKGDQPHPTTDRRWWDSRRTKKKLIKFTLCCIYLFVIVVAIQVELLLRLIPERQHPDPGHPRRHLERSDQILHEVQLTFEVRSPDASGRVQSEHDLRRLASATYITYTRLYVIYVACSVCVSNITQHPRAITKQTRDL